MADRIGAKFMQDGVDVSTGADHEVSFSTEWPALRVVKSILHTSTIRIKDYEIINAVLYNHDLGYTPLFIPYEYDQQSKQSSLSRTLISADERNIYWLPPGGSGDENGYFDITYGLQIFVVDIKKPYEAPTVSPTVKTSGSSQQSYGLQFTEAGDVDNAPKGDFLVDTQTKSPLLHAVITGQATQDDGSGFYTKFEAQHNLPYNPMYFIFVEDIYNDKAGTMIISNNFAGIRVQGNSISVTGLTSGQLVSIVILKDPFDLSGNTEVVTL